MKTHHPHEQLDARAQAARHARVRLLAAAVQSGRYRPDPAAIARCLLLAVGQGRIGRADDGKGEPAAS